MPKLLQVITGLEVGGAEQVMCSLVEGLDPSFEVEVISLTRVGPLGKRLAARGISVRALGLREDRMKVSPLPRLVAWLRDARPDLVQTWMYNADLLGGVASRVACAAPVVWGIHQSELVSGSSRTAAWSRRICARLSRRVPRRIVCCGEAARKAHVAAGYDAHKMAVIPNGTDLSLHRSDPQARSEIRREIGVGPDDPVVGMVARFDPHKDHRTFLRAAGLLAREIPAASFVLCGRDVTPENPDLRRWATESGVLARCRFLGLRSDVPRLTAAFDVATLCSISEALPVVVGEAMACEVPVVVTDVGDAAWIVGDTGAVVPPRRPEALAQAWGKLLRMEPAPRVRLGKAARARIEDQFSRRAMIDGYEALYREILSLGAAPAIG